MADHFQDLTGDIDRRHPRNRGDLKDLVERQNLLARDEHLLKVKGTETLASDTSDIATWMGRYYSDETGINQPKTYFYTQDGKIFRLDHTDGSTVEAIDGLNTDAYPKHWNFKLATITSMYLVDGLNLYEFNGNNDDNWEKLGVSSTTGFIDVIEHKDRLCLLTPEKMMISANLKPRTFDDPVDSIEIVVGSGKGKNRAFGKIDDNLFIFNTEGIFVLYGDVISAVASTFEVRLADNSHTAVAGRSVVNVENALLFLGDDYELWSFNGNSSKMLSYKYHLKDDVNTKRDWLDKAVATYHNNYYMLSFVENGEVDNHREIWYDALEEKLEIVHGRNISCYMTPDSDLEEEIFMQSGRSDERKIMWCDRGHNFDGEGIEIRLRTKDFTPKKGRNVRFTAFYPEIEPTGQREMLIRYLLDGRLSEATDSDSNWMQELDGDHKALGFIRINNQAQFTGRVRPKINYAKGTSIAFEIYDKTKDLDFAMQGIGMDFVDKGKIKSKLVGA